MAEKSGSDIFARLRFFQTESENTDSDPTRPNPATSRVKRCLFGRGDPEENIRFAKRELEKSLQDSKKRWNFDFESERPLDGRFEWHNPYPRFRPASSSQETASGTASKENSNPCSKPSTASESGPSSSSSDSSKASSPKSDSEKPSTAASGAMAKTSTSSSSSSSSTSSSENAGSTSQRTTRQSSINQIFRQRKRSKSKVKTQERRGSSSEDYGHHQGAGLIGDTTKQQQRQSD